MPVRAHLLQSALCRLGIGEAGTSGEIDGGGISGEKLSNIFHDLYVSMAQTAHQNTVLTHRLNRMEQIVSEDDNNRAQIAQHIAGLRNSAEQVRTSRLRAPHNTFEFAHNVVAERRIVWRNRRLWL